MSYRQSISSLTNFGNLRSISASALAMTLLCKTLVMDLTSSSPMEPRISLSSASLISSSMTSSYEFGSKAPLPVDLGGCEDEPAPAAFFLLFFATSCNAFSIFLDIADYSPREFNF